MPNSTTNPPVEIAVPAWTVSGPATAVPLSLTPTNTELLLTRVFVNGSTVVSGVTVLGGSASTVTANKFRSFLFDSGGNLVAASAAVGGASAAAYTGTPVPFSAPYSVVGPAVLYVGIMGDAGTDSMSTYSKNSLGSLPSLATAKVTGLVYATYGLDSAGALSKTTSLTAAQLPVAFTNVVGPVVSLY